MFSTLLDRLGNWNPQLLRELKGRLKPRNVAIAIALSLVSQLLIFTNAWLALPGDATPREITQHTYITNPYCTGSSQYSSYPKCLLIPNTHHYEINWQLWNEDLFIRLSVILTFALLVIGSYLLISNLNKEQRLGTLNFLRLSPRSAVNILGGHLIGAPILVYLAIALAVPLQINAALAAGLGIPELIGFFSLAGITSLTIFSIALLFGLISFDLGGGQAWLASGLILGLEVAATQIGFHSPLEVTALNWLGVFSPITGLRYLIPRLDNSSEAPLYFFQDSLDFSSFSLIARSNALLFLVWTWQALRRKFHNPTVPLINRQDSYLSTLCFQGIILGFTLQTVQFGGYWTAKHWTESAFTTVTFLNLGLFLILIIALSPNWQALRDWSRFRQKSEANSAHEGLFNDLILGDKSPPLVAFSLNLAIAAGCLTLWIILSPITAKTLALWTILSCNNLLMVYACLIQVIMLTRLKRRGLWAAAAIVVSFVLPMFMLAISYEVPKFGLFAPILSPWFTLFEGTPFARPNLFSVLIQWGMIVVLTVLSTRQLHRLGKSASQTVLASSEMMVKQPSPH
ncbi:MAG: hypothetical protein QNJ46_25695 [Leptolyngbyaceae cyanobacterium MO_188.B28]|nr:hypothetical protein [Leptolyngbyaceae cyanobacterium MO_188.B28]